MTIVIKRNPTDRVLELGGGANPHVRPECMGGTDVNVDVRVCENADGQRTVDFTADFNEPLPIASDSFDAVLSVFALEHVSWRNVPALLNEMYRVLKPGGRCVLVIPNTEAQLRWILDGCKCPSRDTDGEFVEASRILFGDLDYPENSHRAYFSPAVITVLLTKAGFVNVKVVPYGEIRADLIVEAEKPNIPDLWHPDIGKMADALTQPRREAQGVDERKAAVIPPAPRERTYGLAYFDNYYGPGQFYWDHPRNELLLRHVLSRRPESVLELGCGRGYLLKRIQDMGIYGAGADSSKHCYMTRACDQIWQYDLTDLPWISELQHQIPTGGKIDLCVSYDFLDHISEEHLPDLVAGMTRTTKRGLHAVDVGQRRPDPNRVTVRDLKWWQERMPTGHEVYDTEALCAGDLPPDYLSANGKVKLNIGCCVTMFHRGWVNMDVQDFSQFAQQFRYDFRRWDARSGLPYGTESVDLIYSSHFLEHISYAEGLKFLKECRRVLKPDGAMRVIVPDARLLMGLYADGAEDLGGPLKLLSEFDHINGNCAAARTAAGKLWAMLHEGHAACYDGQTLEAALTEAGFQVGWSRFRGLDAQIPPIRQILTETLDLLPCLSLYMDAVPPLT